MNINSRFTVLFSCEESVLLSKKLFFRNLLLNDYDFDYSSFLVALYFTYGLDPLLDEIKYSCSVYLWDSVIDFDDSLRLEGIIS